MNKFDELRKNAYNEINVITSEMAIINNLLDAVKVIEKYFEPKEVPIDFTEPALGIRFSADNSTYFYEVITYRNHYELWRWNKSTTYTADDSDKLAECHTAIELDTALKKLKE